MNSILQTFMTSTVWFRTSCTTETIGFLATCSWHTK